MASYCQGNANRYGFVLYFFLFTCLLTIIKALSDCYRAINQTKFILFVFFPFFSSYNHLSTINYDQTKFSKYNY